MAAGSLCDEIPVGISSDSGKPSTLSIYPNPATDLATVVVSNGFDRGSLELFDVSGRAIMTLPIRGSTVALPIGDLSSGSYHLRVFDHDQMITGRFIKE